MNLNLYEYISILTPFVVFNFCLDYLSDSQITQSETKIGMHQLFHHLVATILIGTFTLPFISSHLSVVGLSILVSMGVQVGHRINKDYCWLTRTVNKMIDPQKTKRKWTGGDIGSLMKKYVRGDSWAYSDMGPQNNTTVTLVSNLIHLFVLIKIIVYFK